MVPVVTTALAPVVTTTLAPTQVRQAWKAAQDFEAMTLGEFLKPMFDTVDTAHGPFGGGQGEDQWKPMMVDALARQIAKAGGIGLAKPVFTQMIHMQEMKDAK